MPIAGPGGRNASEPLFAVWSASANASPPPASTRASLGPKQTSRRKVATSDLTYFGPLVQRRCIRDNRSRSESGFQRGSDDAGTDHFLVLSATHWATV